MTVASRKVQQNFDRAAHAYDAHATLQQQQVARLFALATQYLPEQALLLDIGCGTGQFARLAQERPGWRITGLDLSLAMLKQAATRCTALQADAVHLPIADHSVDGVISSLCLQWINDKPAALAEMRRVLKPGGVALLATLGHQSLAELRQAAASAEITLGLLPMESYTHYRALAVDSGLQIASFQHTVQIDYYPSVEALLTSMRAIGAGNAGARRFIPPARFMRMIHEYEAAHATSRGIPASWEPVLMVLKK